MANLVVGGWPAGASVKAYPAAALTPGSDGVPAGAAAETQTASAGGVATFTTLADNTPYVLHTAGVRPVRARIKTSHDERGVATGTVNTTSGSATFSTLTATAGTWRVGMRISGPGIPRGTRIKTLSAGAGTFDRKATATATGAAVEGDGANDPKAVLMRRRHDRGTS